MKKYTQQDMEPHIQNWKASGLSKQAYSKQVNLSYYIFLYWLEKLEPRKKVNPGFHEVKIKSETIKKNPGRIEFHIPTKGFLVFPENCSVELIKSVLSL